MLKTNNATRDIGQSEVCRLLLSEPLYQSTFDYIYISLDINSKQVTFDNNIIQYKKSIIDYYANRYNEYIDKDTLDKIFNILDFVILFKLQNNRLVKRNNANDVVILTKPDIYYNPYDIHKYKDFCYYSLIKYSNWSNLDNHLIENKQNAETNWHHFILEAPERIKYEIK